MHPAFLFIGNPSYPSWFDCSVNLEAYKVVIATRKLAVGSCGAVELTVVVGQTLSSNDSSLANHGASSPRVYVHSIDLM